MVNETLLNSISEVLGTTPRRLVVTGGSGFVGGALAKTLAVAGHEVTAIGRNPYRMPLAIHGVQFVRADIRDRDQIADTFAGQEIVFHAAAKSSAWGDREDFEATNVRGTQNVVDACLQNNVSRLVHISSSAIFFEQRDRPMTKDDDPLASPFSCDYAATKATAEEVVQDGVQRGLNAIVIRARAVFGPGDQSLLPRLIAAARARRLRIFGDGRNTIDMTYIDNLVWALVLASVRGDQGDVITITNDEPVAIWPLVRQVLRSLNISDDLPRVSYARAMRAAGTLEWLHRVRRLQGEPLLTRYTVGLLSKTQTFDQSKAKSQLGYEPIVDMKTGIANTIDALTKQDDVACSSSINMRVFTTGYSNSKRELAEHGGERGPIRFHASCYFLEHPTHGKILFDTGYSPRLFDATRRWPFRVYPMVLPFETDERTSVKAALKEHGIETSEIKLVIVSHFHPDHIGGVHYFPNADFVASSQAWDDVRTKRGFTALKRVFLPDLLPDWFPSQLHTIEHFHDPDPGGVGQTHDLFGDGSIRLVQLPGHAVGQIGAIIATPEKQILLAVDSFWTSRSLREGLPPTLAFRFIADSAREMRATQLKLAQYQQLHPQDDILLTHCPEHAERFGLDQQLERRLGITSEHTG